MDGKNHAKVRAGFCSTPVGRIASTLLGIVALFGASAALAARVAPSGTQPIDALTVGQPKVIPAEFNGDLSKLPPAMSTTGEAPTYRPFLTIPRTTRTPTEVGPSAPQPAGGPLAPMPSPIQNFSGVSKTDACTGGACGSGWPPDPNGDVGPNHYIEAVNMSIAIYNKTGTLLASFTENNLYSGTGLPQCDGHAQGDPVVLYDWLVDRWVLTWFAFSEDPMPPNDPISPFYQCIAASKTADPVTGGWWLYAVRVDPGGGGMPPVGTLNDYSKFGLWHDCLYLSANGFKYPGGSFNGVLFASFNRIDLYAGAALNFGLGFLPSFNHIFTMIPSNNQAKGPSAAQPGTPNYYVSESTSRFEFEVRKFTAGANCAGGGSMSAKTGVGHALYPDAVNSVAQPSTSNVLDGIITLMMQKVQYNKQGAVESLWVTHNVDTPSSMMAMQWAQIDVSGGTVATTAVQQQIHAPDTTLSRWMGSLAVDNQGNMAIGYSTSNGTSPNFPSIAYAGRLATDPLNALPQTETQLFAGNGSQDNLCGGLPCHRWGDYSAMSLDPADECTFWYTNEYYANQANGTSGNWQTRIGSFKFPWCTTPLNDSGGRPTAAAGGTHTLLLNGSRKVTAVGTGGSGQIGDGGFADRVAPVTLALTNILGISAGNAHSLALKNDGTVWAWGFNLDGEVGDTTNTNKGVPTQVSGLTNVMAVSAGKFHSLALKRDGTVWAWGLNGDGQLGNGITGGNSLVPVQVKGVGGSGFLSGVTAIAGGGSHGCALKSDGTEVCWGRNVEGQLGSDGLGGGVSNTPVVVLGLSQVAQIGAGDKHSVALLIDGTVKAWGTNLNNEIGDNTTAQRNTPVWVLTAPATPITGIASIATGADHNLAVSQTGAVFSWGAGGAGQLGSGSVGNRATAQAVDTYANATGVFAGAAGNASFVYHGRGPVQSYGQFQSFGQNPAYQLAQSALGDRLSPSDTAATIFSPLNTFRTCFSQCGGREDLFWRRNDGTNAVYFYNGDKATSFSATFPPGVDTSWTAVGTGDIDGDGISDIVWFQPSTGQVAIWKMSGSGNFAAAFFPGSVGPGTSWQIQAVGDLDGDGSADILWRNTSTKEILVWFMTPQFTIDQAVSFGNLNLAWQIKGIGDIDGDWIKDIIFQHTDGTIAAWKLSPTGQFKSYFLGNVGASSGWQIAKIGDLDGDGREDIFFRNINDGSTAIWYLNGGTVSATQFTPGVPIAVWTLQAIGQFTQTNPPGQIVWTDNGGNAVRWQMTGRGGAPVVTSIGGIGTGWNVVR